MLIPKYMQLPAGGVDLLSARQTVFMVAAVQLRHCCLTPPPIPFGRICFVVLVMRKGGESS